MSSDETRKLAAIMFTDMVGYSALSQRDDKLALELLEEHRELLRKFSLSSTAPRLKPSATLSWSSFRAPWKRRNARSKFSERWPNAMPTLRRNGRSRSKSAFTLVTWCIAAATSTVTALTSHHGLNH